MNYVEKLNCVVENLMERKKKRKITTCLFCFTTRNARQFVYPRIMDGSGHMGGGDSTFGNGDYERQAIALKQYHEDHKHESLCLTLGWLLDITCNPRHELELDLWESKKIRKEKLQARKGKKMACVKPYEKKCVNRSL